MGGHPGIGCLSPDLGGIGEAVAPPSLNLLRPRLEVASLSAAAPVGGRPLSPTNWTRRMAALDPSLQRVGAEAIWVGDEC
jgi:hypothetical protein